MGLTSKERQEKWAKKGSGFGENQRQSEMNRLIEQFQGYGEQNNAGKQRNFADKIRGLGSTFGDDFDADSLMDSLWAPSGSEGYYDPSDYSWGAYSETPFSGSEQSLDVDTGSSLDDLANVPPTSDYGTAMPGWLTMDFDSDKDVARADLQAQWVQDQRRNAGQDRAANVAAQQLAQSRALAEQDVMSDEDVARMLGNQAGQLAGLEGRTQNAIRDSMGARGMAPGGGIGAGMAGNAALRRQMGLAQAGTDLKTRQMTENRGGLERALGLQSSDASNLENILTGFGTTQWELPAPGYMTSLGQEPEGPGWEDYLMQGLGVAGNVAGAALTPAPVTNNYLGY